jgi:HPt (histidine-containing phosphotransfer) domain-containing protein
MSLHVERVDWMPSPPLVPDDGPIDTGHLDRMTLGDPGLEREVLAMFSAQALGLVGKLVASAADPKSSETMELAHRLKGSAQAIGAFAVADAAESLETAVRNGQDSTQALARLKDAVAEARSAIDALLRRS